MQIGGKYPKWRRAGLCWAACAIMAAGGARVAAAPLATPAHELLVQPDDGRTALLAAITSATNYINLAIYEVDDPDINAALIAADQRGARVRILYNYYSFVKYNLTNRLDSIARNFHAGGIEIQPAPQRFSVFHQKSLVVDDRLSIIMTFNLAPTYFKGSRDFGVVSRVPEEIAEINQLFEADWHGQTNAPPAVANLVWSPDNAREKFRNFINAATNNLYVYHMEAHDPESIDLLATAARRGVQVRFISAKLDRMGPDENAPARQALNQADAEAAVGKFMFIHAKAMLRDYGTPQACVFVGSENLSVSSLDHARELGLLLSEPEIVERLYQTFRKDWARILEGNLSDYYSYAHHARKSFVAGAELGHLTNSAPAQAAKPKRTAKTKP